MCCLWVVENSNRAAHLYLRLQVPIGDDACNFYDGVLFNVQACMTLRSSCECSVMRPCNLPVISKSIQTKGSLTLRDFGLRSPSVEAAECGLEISSATSTKAENELLVDVFGDAACLRVMSEFRRNLPAQWRGNIATEYGEGCARRKKGILGSLLSFWTAVEGIRPRRPTTCRSTVAAPRRWNYYCPQL